MIWNSTPAIFKIIRSGANRDRTPPPPPLHAGRRAGRAAARLGVRDRGEHAADPASISRRRGGGVDLQARQGAEQLRLRHHARRRGRRRDRARRPAGPRPRRDRLLARRPVLGARLHDRGGARRAGVGVREPAPPPRLRAALHAQPGLGTRHAEARHEARGLAAPARQEVGRVPRRRGVWDRSQRLALECRSCASSFFSSARCRRAARCSSPGGPCASAPRGGPARWAATAQGREIIDYFATPEHEVIVLEDDADRGAGHAPQTGLATLAAAGDHAKVKTYVVVLNPGCYGDTRRMKALPTEAGTTAELMSAAWAAEMLHVWFYAQGISLPHHPRADFQEKWREIAAELGFPAMTHDDQNEVTWRRSH